MTRVLHHHGSDTPTSPRAILHHTDQFYVPFLHTTVSTYTHDRDFLNFDPN